MCHLLMETAEW